METGSAVTTLLTSVKTALEGSISDALPLAGGIFAAVAAVLLGVKLFKKITGARN